jgi:hypothetical protein
MAVVNCAVTSLSTPTTNLVTLTTIGALVFAPVHAAAVNVGGVTRLTLPAPIRRWNGTTWTYLYRPRS